MTRKEIETDISYLLKDKQEIEESLAEGPNGYLADKLKATNFAINKARQDLAKIEG